MNREHFIAFVWLRYRLRVNQLRRGGAANVAVLGVILACVAVAAVGAGVGGFLVGLLALGDRSPAVVLYAWDAAVGVFLFVWMIALMADLQKSEAVSVEKVLHLPVSPAGAFAVNYLSSLFSIAFVAFLPGFVGFALGLVCSRGPVMLLVLPLLAAFLFAVTALTYQFQGWLAALMSNPRRRRTIIVVMTLGFILVAQTPQVLNIAWVSGLSDDGTARNAALAAAGEELNAALAMAGAEHNAASAAAGEDALATTVAATAALKAGKLTSDQYGARLDQNVREHQSRLDRLVQDYKTRVERISAESQAHCERDRQAVVAARAEARTDRSNAGLGSATRSCRPGGCRSGQRVWPTAIRSRHCSAHSGWRPSERAACGGRTGPPCGCLPAGTGAAQDARLSTRSRSARGDFRWSNGDCRG